MLVRSLPSHLRALRTGTTAVIMVATAAAATSPAVARAQSDAFTYTMRLTSGGQGAGMTILGRGQVSGPNARFEFTDVTGVPIYQKGTVLLMLDGGARTIVVDPREKQYYETDLGALAGGFNAVRGAVGMRMEVTDPSHSVDRVGPGEKLLGQSTERWRATQKFTMKISMMGMKQTSRTESTTDSWYGEPIKVVANPFGANMNALASMFDSPEFTRQMREAAEKLPRRLLLKSVTETVSSDDKGREQRSTSTMEITELSRGAVPASAFEGAGRLPARRGAGGGARRGLAPARRRRIERPAGGHDVPRRRGEAGRHGGRARRLPRRGTGGDRGAAEAEEALGIGAPRCRHPADSPHVLRRALGRHRGRRLELRDDDSPGRVAAPARRGRRRRAPPGRPDPVVASSLRK
jgi:hypothetical protein